MAGTTAVVVGIRALGVEGDRLGVVGDCIVKVTFVVMANATIIIRIGICGVEGNRLGVVDHRTIQIAFLITDNATIVVCFD